MLEVIYRCQKKCPINKQCFVLKSLGPIKEPIRVLQKCPAEHGKDILLTIGGERPP
jgi:hypothetical protein